MKFMKQQVLQICRCLCANIAGMYCSFLLSLNKGTPDEVRKISKKIKVGQNANASTGKRWDKMQAHVLKEGKGNSERACAPKEMCQCTRSEKPSGARTASVKMPSGASLQNTGHT